MKTKLLVLLGIPALLIGCSPKTPTPEPIDDGSINVSSTIPSLALGKADYELKFSYNDNLFDEPSTTINPKLAMLSYGLSCASGSIEEIGHFYTQLEAKDVVLSDAYEETTEHSIGYSFAHRKTDEAEIVFTTVRGFSYTEEWVDNLTIGYQGNHEGFEACAIEIYRSLENYLATLKTKNVKLLVTGYSRAGAVSNVLAHLILSNTAPIVPAKDVYVYTYEAPGCLLEENAPKYKNVFNMVNSADLIPMIPPTKYGFTRCGTDIDIYPEEAETVIRRFDSDIKVPTFAPSAKYETIHEYNEYVIDFLLRDRGRYNLSERSGFVDYLEVPFGALTGMYFSLKLETQNKLMADVGEKSYIEIFDLLNEDNLYNFIKPYLDEDGVEYDSDSFKENCFLVCDFITTIINESFSELTGLIGNISLPIFMHFPDVNYPLVANYFAN